MTTAESLSLLSNIIQQNPQIVGLLSNLSSAFPAVNNLTDVLPHPTLPNPVFRTAVQNPIQQIPLSQYTAKRKYLFTETVSILEYYLELSGFLNI